MSDVTVIQGDLFALDSPLRGSVRGERSLMAYPFFALTKQAWMTPLKYETDMVSIEVGPGPKGIANIYDKEVLLYIASIMATKLDNNEVVTQEFHFTAHDLFRVTGVSGSARSYNRLFEALERLQGTQIKTDIETGGEGETGFFSWLESAKLQYSKSASGDRRLKSVKVRLCDWLFRAILRDRQVLQYAPTYFQLSPVERRLYEVARACCSEAEFCITIGDLKLQTGYQSSARHFKQQVKDAAGRNSIPGYRFSIDPSDSPNGKVALELVRIVPERQASIASQASI